LNIDEFIAGTLPGDAASYFMIDQIIDTEIFWTEHAGRTYDVYWTDVLTNPFVRIATDAAGGRFDDTTHGTNDAGFYLIAVGLE
jgi:hypothetical protein